MRKYLLYSTVAALFSEALYVHSGIDWKIFYPILAVNLVLMIYLWDFRLRRGHIAILLVVFLLGIVGAWRGTDKVSTVLAEFSGITLASVYFYAFFRTQRKSVEEIFSIYAAFAFFLAVFGLIKSFVLTLIIGGFVPVRSVATEPAHFATLVFPAFAYYLFNGVAGEKCKGRAALLGFAILLSGSAIAFINFLLIGLLVFRKRMTTTVAGLAAAVVFFATIYAIDPHTQVRVNDTLKVAQTSDVAGANLSTYALLSNAYVTASVLQRRPFLGYGLGAHQFAHQQFIESLPGVSELDPDFMRANATDADSLMLRTASEFGLIGVASILWFIWAYRVRGEGLVAAVNLSILTYFSLKLLREGTWFSPEMYFFVWAYVLTSDRFTAKRRCNFALKTAAASA